MAKDNKIEKAIRTMATEKLHSKYNLPQYKDGAPKENERKTAIAKKKTCQDIINFADQHKEIPLYFILSVGVAKGAYKLAEFEKGYKNFNPDKVLEVHRMGMLYNEYNGLKNKKMSDVTIRLIMRYYEKKSNNMEDFKRDLNNSKVLGKLCGSRTMNYTELCKNLNIPTKDDNNPITEEAA